MKKMNNAKSRRVEVNPAKLVASKSRLELEALVLKSLESGKPIADCETIDIPESIHTILWSNIRKDLHIIKRFEPRIKFKHTLDIFIVCF